MTASVWEAIFMLVVLKIPMAYLAAVVWWAIRAEPVPGTGAEPVGVPASLAPCGWHEWRRSRQRRPLGRGPVRPRGRSGRSFARLRSPRVAGGMW